MSYGEVFSSINDKLENLSNIIDEIKSALYDIYVDTEEDEFMAVINNLYNKGSEEDPKDFLGANFKAFPTSTGLIGINEKIEYYGELKLAIFNTLRALGVDIANDAGFSNYASLIRSFEVPENKYLPVSDVITEGVTTTTTRLLLAAEEGYSYLYLNTKYIPKYGDSYEDLLDAGFVRFYGDEEVYVDRNNRYLVIIKAKGETTEEVIDVDGEEETIYNTIYTPVGATYLKAELRDPEPVESVEIQSEPSTTVANAISISYDNIFIADYYVYYKKYENDVFLEGDIVEHPELLDRWDKSSDIVVSSNDELIFIFTDTEFNVLATGRVIPTPSHLANELDAYCSAGSEFLKTVINFNQPLGINNLYVYKFDKHAPLYDVELTNYTRYNVGDQISALSGQYLTVFEIDVYAKVKKFKVLQAVINSPALDTITVESTEGTKFNETILTLSRGKLNPTNKFFIMPATNSNYPVYGQSIPVEAVEWNGTDSVFYKNGTRIMVIETSSANIIVAVGLATVSSLLPYLETLKLTSVKGTAPGYTLVYVNDNTLGVGNSYYYKHGNIPAVYDMSVDTTWTAWYGEELYGFKDKEEITIIEASSDRLCKKIGVGTVTIKGLELIVFTMYSRKAPEYFYTTIAVNNVKASENHYVYKFQNELPTIYEDVSDWTAWNGIDNIYCKDETTLCVVEAGPDNKALKAGLVDVRYEIKIDLGVLTVTASCGEPGVSTILSIEEEKSEGYIYLYKLTADLPEYHQNLEDWDEWDGEEPIVCNNADYIVVAECTIDKYAVKAGRCIAVTEESE